MNTRMPLHMVPHEIKDATKDGSCVMDSKTPLRRVAAYSYQQRLADAARLKGSLAPTTETRSHFGIVLSTSAVLVVPSQ
jgi:hypothetical protein